MFWLLYLVPKNLLSALFGRFAGLRLPKPLSQTIIHWFAKRYGVCVEDSARPLESFESLTEFFVRDLRPGVRPVQSGFVSPVDGKLTECGAVERGVLIQAKGKLYTVRDLLQDDSLAKRFESGVYATIYLAPGDYHHIHAPVAGEVEETIHIPGLLWPVNSWSLNNITELFCKNERVVIVLKVRDKLCAVVLVGATNVGSIRVTYDKRIEGNKRGLGASLWGGLPVERYQYASPVCLEKGARLGTFYLGSTVVLLMEQGLLGQHSMHSPKTLRYGETIGELAT